MSARPSDSQPSTPLGDDVSATEELRLPTTESTADLPDDATVTPAPRRRRRRILVAAGIAAALLLGSGGALAANAHKQVSLEADGSTIDTSSWRGSVAGLLEDQGIVLGEHDEVLPALDEPLRDGALVQILRAQPIAVLRDGTEDVLWTTADDAGAALAAAALEDRVQLVVSRSAARAEIDLPISGDVRIESFDGEITGTVPDESTLEEAIAALAVAPLSELDEVTVTADADATTVVTIVRVVVSERVEQIEVPFAQQTVESANYYTGTRRVTTEGVNGSIERRYTVTTRDGQVISDTLASEVTTQGTVDEVTTVGTKPRPVVVAPAPVAPASSGSSDAAPATTVSGDVWAALAQCESGGNPSAVSSSGKYHGLYQFSVSTWQAVGGSGLPSQASASEQTERAQALQARSGWGQWPHCSSKLGLR